MQEATEIVKNGTDDGGLMMEVKFYVSRHGTMINRSRKSAEVCRRQFERPLGFINRGGRDSTFGVPSKEQEQEWPTKKNVGQGAVYSGNSSRESRLGG